MSKERAAMGKVCLVLSMQDYNTIAEALLESALDWEHAADELGCLHQFCARTGDPAYGGGHTLSPAKMRKHYDLLWVRLPEDEDKKEGPSRSDTATRA